MSSLLVPLDGSDLAEESLPWAGELSRSSSRPVRLLGVYGYDSQLWESAGIDPFSDLAVARARLQAYLDQVATSPELDGVTVTNEVRAGDVAEEIAASVAEHAADLVVITSRGAGGRERGSVADRLMRTATVPLLVVPPGASLGVALTGVVVTLDGSAPAHAALPVARDLAELAGAKLHLLHVVDAAPGWGGGVEVPRGLADALAQAARQDLEGVVRGEEIAAVRQGKLLDTILEYAAAEGCQVIVMATHGRGGRARLDLGSTAEAVLRAADRPVLLVPAR